MKENQPKVVRNKDELKEIFSLHGTKNANFLVL
jgi:hypothetical protein